MTKKHLAIEEREILLITKICPQCQKRLIRARKDKIFCSNHCRFKYWAKRHPRTKIIC